MQFHILETPARGGSKETQELRRCAMGRGAEKKDWNHAVADLEGWKHNTTSKERTKVTRERKGEKEKS
ncbi:hypothetical protein Csa_011884 [Cucumis sativus]|uniref:Uncharacterized protein n=1 Tax=Cucumis sativus TaxID=3659 RepID=A0A0A0K553_CUCSA|nr:hypothetical protein Csa_011884 [Cucumis sativus]